MNYAIIKDGKVANIMEWDGVEPLAVAGQTVPADGLPVFIGQDYTDGQFVFPPLPPVPPDPPKTAGQARAEGEDYVMQFFTLMELQRLMLLLTAGNAAQMAKTQAVLAWLNEIEAAWLAAPESFDTAAFGSPPHTYAEILET